MEQVWSIIHNVGHKLKTSDEHHILTSQSVCAAMLTSGLSYQLDIYRVVT